MNTGERWRIDTTFCRAWLPRLSDFDMTLCCAVETAEGIVRTMGQVWIQDEFDVAKKKKLPLWGERSLCMNRNVRREPLEKKEKGKL